MSRPGWTSLLLCAASLVSQTLGDRPTQVAYFSFISSVRNDTETPQGPTSVYNELLLSDDSPFQQVDLPWKFNLLGTNINRLFINPNGGLHASNAQPCPPENYFMTNDYGLYNSYYNVIAGFLTDLNPHTSPDGNITSYVSSDHLTVDFQNLVYFGLQVSISFRVHLFTDSHIEIAYDRIIKIPGQNAPKSNMWSSGLRAYQDAEYAYFTPDQRSFAQAEWVYAEPSEVTGVFPSKAEVVTSNQFNICPVSRVWCVSLAVVSRNSTVGANPAPYVTLTTALLSCASTVEYGAVFAIHNATYTIPCEVVRNVSLQCNISYIIALNMSVGEYTVTPAWRTPNTSTYTLLPVDSVNVTIVDSTLYNTTAQNYTVGCANNQYNSSCAGGSCAMCEGDYSCLNQTCSASTNVADEEVPIGLTNTIYNQVTCADTCPQFTYNASEAYYTDNTNTCCTLSQTDCSGKCNGTSQLAHDADHAVVCCSRGVDCMGLCGGTNVTDCAGVCGGTAVVDTCGDCGGKDKCYETSQVSIKSVIGQASLFPVYDISAGPGGYSDNSQQLNVTNESTFQIRVVLSEISATRKISPILSIPVTTLVVQPQSYAIVDIGSSIAPLMNNANTTWTNKYVEVQYQRVIDADPQDSVQVYVYPQVTGCNINSARLSCLRLPGCIFCYDSPLMRLLRQDTHNNTIVDGHYSDTSFARRLFIELVPWSLGDPGDSLTGICTDGWLNEDCAAAAPYAFTSSASSVFGSAGWLSVVLAFSVLLFSR